MRLRLRKDCLRHSRIFRFEAPGSIFAAILTLTLLVSGCGYRVVGRANVLPEGAHTLAIPAFTNRTAQYRIEQILTEAVAHEFIARTKYRVVPETDGADLVLNGDVTGISSAAVLYDPVSGRATTVLVTLSLRVVLHDSAGKILFQNNNLVFRQPYEISVDIPSFFQEEGPALDRMSRDFAAQLVSDVLENF
jgi:outer membrane lipopolysaccharide assembly protein LptE/RlpB